LFLLIPGYFLVKLGFALYKGYKSRNWPEAEGLIVASEVEEEWRSGKEGGHMIYKPTVCYRYVIQGRTFTGTCISPSHHDAGMSLRSWAANTCERYSAGSHHRVYYDPDNPADSVLEPGVIVTLPMAFRAVISFILVAVGIAIIRGAA
jgi:hypothetical protein